MKKLTVLLLFTLSFWVSLSAQDIESWIKSKKAVPFEKLYLHVDRELYATGDIIWLKAYHVNGVTHQLNSNLRNIFVQLVAEDGQIVKDLMLLSINGQANGEFRTDSLANGNYTIRAFTRYLENFGEEALFHKKIGIYKSTRSVGLPEKVQTDNSKIDVSFLPEGGNLVLNAVNTIAFKAINSKGKGIFIRGKIRNENGDTITSFATSYLGMGKFNLMPEDGKSYYATIDRYPELKIQLPQANTNGICLNYKENSESLLFGMSANMKLDKQPVFYFVASYKGVMLSNEKIEMTDNTQTLNLSKKLFPKGISKISLLDTAFNPIAERLIFVDDGKSDLLSLRLNQKEFKPREEVKIDVDALLETGDSIASTMSVAVVNKNYLSTGDNSQNIKSYLLLDSDLKGAIESPASYFVDDELHTSAEKLDLLMLVHGWRTYLWDDVEQTQAPSLEAWNDAGINVSGYVKKILWKAHVPNVELSLDYVFRHNSIGRTRTDQNGRFLFKNAYFIDTLKVMVNAHTKEGSRNLEIILDPLPKKDSIVMLGNKCFNIDLNPNFNRDNSFRLMKELNFSPEKGTILLKGVDVVKQKSPLSRSWGTYPWADKTLTITKDDYRFGNVIRYLEQNVPAFMGFGDSYTMKGKPVSFMVDGQPESDFNVVNTIRMNDIELIDILDPDSNVLKSVGIMGDRPKVYGLIAIYRKTNNRSFFVPLYDINIKGRIIPELRGFDRPAQFYSPEYTLENIDSPKPDFRPTLYWNPEISFVNGKVALDFFTADAPADYVVYMEGISKNGKICFGTTSFSVVKKQ